jgi:hypothetical protein
VLGGGGYSIGCKTDH